MSYPAVFQLSSLNGTNGFRLVGRNNNGSYQSGTSVASAGDFNGDGFADLLIGAPGADPAGGGRIGETYLVFGRADGFTASFSAGSLDGTNGFRLLGRDRFDSSGNSVAGNFDINGDGFADIIIGARGGDHPLAVDGGEAAVIFGGPGAFGPDFDLDTLDGSNGFHFSGIDPFGLAGFSVSGIGDFDGDGLDDVIIGELRGFGEGISDTSIPGAAYIIYGKSENFAANLNRTDLIANGRVFRGNDGDYSGVQVSGGGDFNGDGFDDIIVGTLRGGATGTATTYIVFGSERGVAAQINPADLNGFNGFTLEGIFAERSYDSGPCTISGTPGGATVANAGDLNADGRDDLIVSYPATSPGDRCFAGSSFVIFGSDRPFPAVFNVADINGNNGFRINGADINELTGQSIAGAGDINGDGFDDLIIGAPLADVNYLNDAGRTYVVLGRGDGFDPVINLSDLNGDNGFRIEGIEYSGNFGISVASAGDINGDGLDDIVVGERYGGINNQGHSYVIFGIAPIEPVTRTGTAASQNLVGGAFDDTLSGRGGNDLLTGNGGNDVLNGEADNDILRGGTGNDTLNGGTGLDTLEGGDGNDIYFVDNAGDIVTEAAGQGSDEVRSTINYTLGANIENLRLNGAAALTGTGNALGNNITAGVGPATLTGLAGNDALFGSQAGDFLDGGDDNDTLFGRNGEDLLNGGNGNDVINGQNQGDTINGGEGNDLLRGDGGNDIVNGGNGNDNLQGGANNDTLNGDAGIDALLGGDGNDTLNGGDGNDTLSGDAGRDFLTGGLGGDSFRFDDGHFSGTTDVTADRIFDFSQSQGDRIDLSLTDAVTGGSDNAFTFIGSGAFTGVAGQLRFQQFGGSFTLVSGDTNGDGAADFAIRVDGLVTFVASDFVL